MYVPLSVEFDNLLNSIQDNEDEPLSRLLIYFLFRYINKKLKLYLDLINFTDEEGYGKFLDLNECHYKYVNIKGIEVLLPK